MGGYKKFYHRDSSVDKEDFGTLNSGWQGLDESDFHWHVGHGLHGLLNDGDIALYDYSIWNPSRKVDSWYVERKWDLNNEWVVFQSCYVLEDPNWAAALKYSHMLLGFETVTYIDSDLPEKFFEYAINKNWKIFDAYKKATIETFGSDVEAAVYIDAGEQINDHLWGHRICCSRRIPG